MTEKTIPGCPICAVCSTYVVEWNPDGQAHFFGCSGKFQSYGNNPKYMSTPLKFVVHCTTCHMARSDLFYDEETDSVKVLDKR